MMNVLDALRYRLAPPGSTDLEGEQIDPGLLEAMRMRSRSGQPLPPGLPLGVRDSILNQPSYGEGEVVPFAPNAYSSQYATNGSPLFEQERQAMEQFGGAQRDTPLANEVGYDEYLRRRGVWPMPDTGVVGSMRQPGQSPFASPLNQFLQRRGPFALY